MKKNWKKTLAAVGFGMVLTATSLTPVTALAAVDTQNLLTFVNDTMDDGSQVYYFEEVAVTLPADWQGKVAVQTQDTSVTFYHKEREMAGKLRDSRWKTFFLILFGKQ